MSQPQCYGRGGAGATRAGHVTLRQLLVLLAPAAAVIWATLTPFRVGTREHGNPHTCSRNVRQLGTAFLAYTLDWDERYPPANEWAGCLSVYTKYPPMFTCPQRRGIANGYGYNRTLHQLTMTRVAHPDLQPVLFDSRLGIANGADYLESFTRPHNGGGYVGYADGRAKWHRDTPRPDAGLVLPPTDKKD